MASETNNGKAGGLLKGKRHEDKNGKSLGGIKAIVTDTNQMVELEGGEVIINREASKKHWKELSRINQSAGNGVPILPPDKVLADTEEYKSGGNTIEFNPNLLPNKWIYEYAKRIKDKYPKVWAMGGNQFGNEAFSNLERALKRGYWTQNEDWMFVKWQSFNARHKQDFRIEGVIANLKWLNKVNKGWDYMKALIEKEIEKQYPTGWKHKKKNGGELAKGIKTEKEHEGTLKKVYEHKISPKDAPKYVAKDHLKENPRYYSKLAEMESKFAGGGKLPDLNQVLFDASSFRPDGQRANDEPQLDVKSGTIEFAFRDLGNWVNDEEDRGDDDFDEEQWEDNDNRIWAGGQYAKYKRLFETWAEKFDWYKYAKLDIQTGEKDWAYFYITIKNAEVKKEETKTTPPPTKTTPPPPKKKEKKDRKPPAFKVGDYFQFRDQPKKTFKVNSTKDIKVAYSEVGNASNNGSMALSTFSATIRAGTIKIIPASDSSREKPKFEFKVNDWFTTDSNDEPFVIVSVNEKFVRIAKNEGDQSSVTYPLAEATKKVETGIWQPASVRIIVDGKNYAVVNDLGEGLRMLKKAYGDAEYDKMVSNGQVDIGVGKIEVTTKTKSSSLFKKLDLVINNKHPQFLGQVFEVYEGKNNGVEKYAFVLSDGTHYTDVTSDDWRFAEDDDLEKLFVGKTLVSKKVGEAEIQNIGQHEPKLYTIYTGKYHFEYSGSDLFDLLSGLEVHDERLKKETSETKTEEKPNDASDFEFIQKTPTGAKTKLTYLQQVLVRSKQFKAWFGDWETASKNYIANGKKDFDKDFENVSKVIDMDTLEPRVVFHGTPRPEEFFVFETKATGLNRPYAYFAHNIEYSQNFHSNNGKVLYHCFLNVRNPFRAEGKGFEQRRESADYWEEKIIGTIAWDKYGAIRKDDKGAIEVKKTMSAMGNYLQALAGNSAPFWKIMSFDIIGLFKAFLQYYKYDGMFYSEEWKAQYDPKNPAEFTRAICVFDPTQIKLADGRNLTFDGSNPDIRYEAGGGIAETKNEHSINRKNKIGRTLFGDHFESGGNIESETLNGRIVETSPPKRESESVSFVNDLIKKMNK